MADEVYTCAMCGGTFNKGWSDEEAVKEYAAIFPDEFAADEPVVVICDECFVKVDA